MSAIDSTGASGKTHPSCAATMAATACTPSEISPPSWISAERAPTQPSARRIGATTAPRKPGRDETICISPVRYAAAAAYRTGEMQIVSSRPGFRGAVVAPILRADGCVGALSAEIQDGGEISEGVQADR